MRGRQRPAVPSVSLMSLVSSTIGRIFASAQTLEKEPGEKTGLGLMEAHESEERNPQSLPQADVTPTIARARNRRVRTRHVALGGLLAVSLLAFGVFRYVEYRLGRNDRLDLLNSGLWNPYVPRGRAAPPTQELQARIQELEAIGYLAGSSPAPAISGVTLYSPDKAYDGFNLYTTGNAARAFLMDMQGNVLHTWQYPFEDIWPEALNLEIRADYRSWRRAHLWPDGSLLAIFEGYGAIKIDCDSRLLWARLLKYHHDMAVLNDGRIVLLSRKAHILPRINPDFPVLEDFLCILDPDGNETRRFSLLEAFENSDYRDLLKKIPRRDDIFHTNTVQYLDGAPAGISPAFERGNLLICVRQLNTVAVVNPDSAQVVWALRGPWGAPHEPTLLNNGHMLIFDNRGLGGRSQVVEFDPMSGTPIWSYGGEPAEFFFSNTCGSCQRLPNGNTLITESNNGRAFEVTPDKEIVWEYVNPARAGEHDEMIATLFEMVRLGPDFPLDWLEDHS